MLLIRPSQLSVLAAMLRSPLVSGTMAHLRRRYPKMLVGWSDQSLDAFCGRVVARGIDLGIVDEQSAAHLATLMLFYGEQLERSGDATWAADVLAHPELPGRVKVEALVERLLELSDGRPVLNAA